ncbi:MAG: GNAT family N-acetyltransferase [Pseudomonadota bacterium]
MSPFPNTVMIDDVLMLRDLKDSDHVPLFEIIQHNKDFFAHKMNWVRTITNLTDAYGFVLASLADMRAGISYTYVMLAEQQVVGVIIIYLSRLSGKTAQDHGKNQAESRSGRLGYWLDQRAGGRGLMTRCVQTLSDTLLNSCVLDQVAIHCATDNLASNKVARAAGFTYTHDIKQAEVIGVRTVDHHVYVRDPAGV